MQQLIQTICGLLEVAASFFNIYLTCGRTRRRPLEDCGTWTYPARKHANKCPERLDLESSCKLADILHILSRHPPTAHTMAGLTIVETELRGQKATMIQWLPNKDTLI